MTLADIWGQKPVSGLNRQAGLEVGWLGADLTIGR